METIIHESGKSSKTYKCPYCDYRGIKEKLIRHIDNKHQDMIPEGFTASRVVFNLINKKTLGSCIICGKETDWNEEKCRYERLCKDPKCKAAYREKVESRVKKVYGKTSKELLRDPDHQAKMLAGRKISGVYKWSDGEYRTYTGEYERKCLEFLDSFGYRSEDIVTPGPVIEYMYKGEKHLWITDIFVAPYNLAIDCKDGGDNPNNRPMREYREKQIEKEKAIAKQGKYNYLRLTNNNFKQLLEVLSLLKLQFVEDNRDERIIRINEAMFADIGGFMPPDNINNVYIVNYKKNNVFAGIGLSKDLSLDNMIVRDIDGILKRKDKKFLEDASYSIYLYTHKNEINYRSIAESIDSYVEEGFLYESIFHKTYYTLDQILSENLTECIDLSSYYQAIEEITKASILGNENRYMKTGDGCYMDEKGKFYMNESSDIRTPSRYDKSVPTLEMKIISEGGI